MPSGSSTRRRAPASRCCSLLALGLLAWCLQLTPSTLLFAQPRPAAHELCGRTSLGLATGSSSLHAAPAGRLTARKYWNQPGPQPEKTTEGTVIPLLILAVLGGGLAMWPMVFGMSPAFIAACGVLCFVSIGLNVLTLAGNKNLPTYIDELAAKNKDGK
mmetsp:Transcript_71976/g.161103  ORF Transcript_71976/g.161103 Transcript_71976/m.161103 type:complete len:159 (-) Transcript_71976:123-599(-)